MSRVATRWIEWSSDGTAGPFTLSSADDVFSLNDGTATRIQVGPGAQVFFPSDTTMQGGLEVLGTTTIINADNMHSDKLTVIHSVNDPAVYVTQTGPLSTAPVVQVDSSGTGAALQVTAGIVGVTTTPVVIQNVNADGAASVVLNNNSGNTLSMAMDGTSLVGTNFGQNLAGAAMIRADSTMSIGTVNANPLVLGTNNTARIIIDKDGNISYGDDGESTYNYQISSVAAGFYYHVGDLTIVTQGSEGIVHGFSTISATANGNVYHNNWVLKVRQNAPLGSAPDTIFWTVNETAPYTGFSSIAVIRQNNGAATKIGLYTYAPETGSLVYDLSVFSLGTGVSFAKEIGAISWDNIGTKIPEESRTTKTELTTEGDFRFNLAVVDSEGVGAQGEGSGIVFGDNVGANVYGLAGIKAYKSDSTANAYSGQMHFQTRLNGNLATTKMVIDQNGKIGIGTTAPGGKMDIFGTNSDVRFVRSDGLRFGSMYYGTGMLVIKQPASDDFEIQSSTGTNLVHVASSGNVGIGTTTPSDLLVVNGNAGLLNTGALKLYGSGINSSSISNPTSGRALQFNVDITAMYITNTGNVGIGTTNPTVPLEIYQPTANGVIAMFGDSNSNGRGYIYLSDENTINSGYNVNANTGIYLNYHGYQAGSAQYRDTFIADGKTNTIAMFQGSTGRVGIGTTPSFKLHVVGTQAIVSEGTTGINPEVYLRSTANANTGILRFPTVGINFEDASNNVRMFIDASGNVGIGVTIPLALLHTNGTMRWGGNTTNYGDSGEDAAGLYLEQFGSTVARSAIRLQTSKSSDTVNWSQFIIDPYSGFKFLSLGTGSTNVGIGTSPVAQLDVFSATVANDYIHWSSTSGPSSGGIRAGGSWAYDTQLYSAQPLSFKAGGFNAASPHMVILTAGLVGIGTTNALAQLHVKGAGNTGIIIDGQTGTSEPFLQFYQNGTATGYIQQRNAGYLEYQSKASGPHYFIGNVGIGTTSPIYNLHVYGTSAAGTYSMVRNTSAATTSYAGSGVANNLNNSLQLLAFSSGYSGTTYGGIPNADMGLIFANQTGGLLIEQFANYPMYLATNNIIRMTIGANGNVGIGSGPIALSPPTKLYVEDMLYSNTPQTNTVSAGSSVNGVGNIMGTGGYWTIRTDGANSFNLDVYNGGSGNQLAALTVLQNGSVGIGITTLATIASAVEMANTSGSRNNLVNILYNATSSVSPAFRLVKSHTGTKGTLVTTVNGESIGALIFNGIGSANALATAGVMKVLQTGSAGTSSVPVNINIEAGNGTSTNANQLVLTSSGTVGIGISTGSDLLSVYGNSTDSKMSFYSGNASNFTGFLMGRASEEGALGVSAAGSQWVNGSAPGDFCIRSSTGANKVLISGDAGTTPSLAVTPTFVGIGTTSPVIVASAVEMATTSNSVNAFTNVLYSATTAAQPGLRLVKSHTGTKGSLVTTINGENTGLLVFSGVGSSNTLATSAVIKAVQTGAAGVSSVPSNLNLETGNGTGTTNANQLVLSSNGYVGIGTSSPGATLHVRGSEASLITNVSTTYGVLPADFFVAADPTGGGFTVTLPQASTVPAGRRLIIKNVGTANNVTLSPFGAPTGDYIEMSQATRTITPAGAFGTVSLSIAWEIICDGVNRWHVISHG